MDALNLMTPQTPVPQPMPIVPPVKRRAPLVALVVVLSVAAGLAFGYWAYQRYGIPGLPAPAPGMTESPTPVMTEGEHVRWEQWQAIANPGFIPDDPACLDAFCRTENYRIGTFTDGPYEGGVLYRVLGVSELGGQPNYLFLDAAGKRVLLQRHSDTYWTDPAERSQLSFVIDDEYRIPELVYPAFLTVPSEDFILQESGPAGFFGYRFWREFRESELVKVFDSPYGPVWTDRVVTVPPPTPGPGVDYYARSYGFYLRAPDGSAVTYVPKLDFIGEERTTIQWNPAADGYTYGDFGEYFYYTSGGCGRSNYVAVVPPYEVNMQTDLVQAGRTTRGEPVYVYRDPDREDLRNLWDFATEDLRRQHVSYETFLRSHPLFFWKDPFGRLIRFQAKATVPPAECGKPVIYLYPEQPMHVSVKVEPVDGMSVSDPAYGDGWNVTAYPDGRLVQTSDGAEYPYLFWEGRGGLYRMPERGWVIPRDGVEAFLDNTLARLGLIPGEIADFREFWLPRMQAAPWYFITFMGNRHMDALAPLTVSPRPDTVIRILMDYEPLQKPREAEGFVIRTPERRGFTVVEWGGVLGR